LDELFEMFAAMEMEFDDGVKMAQEEGIAKTKQSDKERDGTTFFGYDGCRYD
jgi:hypothetical protein